MKKLLVFIILTISILAQNITGKVVSVTDGDTIKVLENNKEYKIRFSGIDAPEKSQDYGQKSKQFLSNLIFGKIVKVEIRDIDKYNRYVSDVYLENVWINSEMIKNGYAWHYKQYSKDQNLAKLEDTAKEKKLGLWADKNPVAPWDYRHGTKNITETEIKNSKEKLEKSNTKENVVYITKTGKKYHREGCSSLAKSKFEISRADAIAEGYTACKKCKP